MPDYSCYIILKNTLDVALTRIGHGTGHGYWESEPLGSIAAGSTSSQFQTKDHFGSYGSDGWVQYRVELQDIRDVELRPIINVNFGNPTGDNDNWHSCSCVNGLGSALFSFSNTPFAKRDHPLTVTGTISYNTAITTTAAITNLQMPDPVLNIYNTQTPSQNRKAANQVIWDSANPHGNDDNTTTGVAGSYSPVTMDLAAAAVYLNVTINITNDLIGVPFYVQADLGADLNVLNNPNPLLFTSAGTQVIRATIQPEWQSATFPWGMTGDVVWKLSVGPTRQSIPITTTRLEIYGLTSKLRPFFENQIGVLLLRAIVLPARDRGTDWVQYVINTAFGTYGTTTFRYDTKYGLPRFGVRNIGGDFNLHAWIALRSTPGTLLNCFDQAAILQICLALVPDGTSNWLYQEPFGYIAPTNLIGVGLCNNPVFGKNGTPPMVGNNDAQRTKFDNHAFVSIVSRANRIGDACGGPHLASENLEQYIAASIQQPGNGPNETTLYTSTNQPGTKANVKIKSGVFSINGGASTMTALTEANEIGKRTVRAMEMASMASAAPTPYMNLDISFIHETITRRSSSKLLYHYQEISAGGSEIRWVLDSDSSPTTIDVAILSTPDHARAYFENHLGKYQRPLEEVFTAPPIGMEKGQFCLTSPATDTSHALMVWVRGNVFAHVSTASVLDKLESSYGAPLDQAMRRGACEESELKKPVLRSLRGPTRSVKVGQEFTIYPSIEECGLATVRSQNIIAVHLTQDATTHVFRFRAEKSGTDILHFAFAHSVTGMVISEEFKVSAVEWDDEAP